MTEDYSTLESQTNVTYRPEAIGTADLTAGPPEQTWPEYGLEMVPVLHSGEDTGRRLIRRNGEYLADVSDRYKLVPNEQVVHAANDVARDLGAVPFHEFSGDWFVRLQDHVFQDPAGRRVHALYAWDDPVDVGEGDETDDIQFGFAVHNSIDGSLSFQVGLFTFRHACQNMVTMGIDGRGMGFDDREVVAHATHRHTKGLDVNREALAVQIKNVMVLADGIEDQYRAWRDQFVTVGDVQDLIRRLPNKDLPEWADRIRDNMEKARDNESLDGEGVLTAEREERIIRNFMPNETVWSTYNDVTESIWHDSDTSDTRKDQKFNDLHRVFDPHPEATVR